MCSDFTVSEGCAVQSECSDFTVSVKGAGRQCAMISLCLRVVLGSQCAMISLCLRRGLAVSVQ